MPHAEVMHDEDHDLMKLIRKAGRLHEEGRDSDAQAVYLDVWKQADKPEDDYHACMAAHMLGVMETSLDEKLRWHVESLERANRVQDRRRQRASTHRSTGILATSTDNSATATRRSGTTAWPASTLES